MDFAAQVAQFAALAEKKGMMNSLEGNLSVIDRETERIYITPSHKAKALLTPEQICVVAPSGEQVGGSGKRSSEYFLHEAAYKACPNAGAVLHTHVPYLSAYAFAYRDFETAPDTFLHQIFGTIRCLPFGAHGTHEIHRGIEDALKASPVVLLGGHGVVCVGEDAEDALGIMEAAENYAKTLFLRKNL